MLSCTSTSTLVTGVFPTISLNALICFSSGLVQQKSHSDFPGYSFLLHLISRAVFLHEVNVTVLLNADLKTYSPQISFWKFWNVNMFWKWIWLIAYKCVTEKFPGHVIFTCISILSSERNLEGETVMKK